MNALNVYIGYDPAEHPAYLVAEHSLVSNAGLPVRVTPLREQRLAEVGLLRRPTDLRGQRYDLPSNAPANTGFAISRFLTPILAQTGWALFVDSDVVFLGDVAELFALADDRYAVMCVQHNQQVRETTKNAGQGVQVKYSRKNWSSVMLFNCDHPANRRLSLVDVQERRGFDLHNFYWLADAEIGELPVAWNWLVNVQERPANARLAHFTLGGPFFEGWQGADNDDIWIDAWQRVIAEGGHGRDR